MKCPKMKFGYYEAFGYNETKREVRLVRTPTEITVFVKFATIHRYRNHSEFSSFAEMYQFGISKLRESIYGKFYAE